VQRRHRSGDGQHRDSDVLRRCVLWPDGFRIPGAERDRNRNSGLRGPVRGGFMRRIAFVLTLVALVAVLHACAADAPTKPPNGGGGGNSPALSVQLFTS